MATRLVQNTCIHNKRKTMHNYLKNVSSKKRDTLMEAQSFNQNLVLFPNHFVPFFWEFKHTIAFYYETQHSLTCQGHVPNPKSLGYSPNCCK